MKRLTHIDFNGRAQMVDVSAKPLSKRRAIARGKIRLQQETLNLIARNQIAKGNVFATARIAGIQAAKQTAHLIPLCHTLSLSQVTVDIAASKDGAEVKCTAQTVAQTGVEMEALVRSRQCGRLRRLGRPGLETSRAKNWLAGSGGSDCAR